MSFKGLKRIRVVISLFFFLITAFLFLDFTNSISAGFISGILWIQFIPSVIKFVRLLTWSAAGFIFVPVLTFTFGRVYCSAFCPLGALQDIAGFISKKLGKKKTYKFSKPLNILRYSFLALIIVFLSAGSMISISLLDPYSIFGKIISNLFRPVYYAVNNAGAFVLEKINIFTLYPVELKSYSWLSAGFSLFMLILVVRLAYKKGRLYCNAVCPVGTFLGLLSRASLYRIRLDDTLCTGCGICSAVCKAGCISSKERKVDFSRCVVCLNCLTVCEGGGVKFDHVRKPPEADKSMTQADTSRRTFIRNSVFIPVSILVATQDTLMENNIGGTVKVVREFPVTPPGALGLEHFTRTCTACHLCISACPTGVLQPSLLQYGWQGMMQPVMDYKVSFCNFECTVCSDVCPTGAILPIETEQKKLTQIGISKFIRENCIVYIKETACGACSEHCPTKAVNMVPYKGRLNIPEVNSKICIGCGACEYACPTDPKSIFVDGNAIHVLAEKPKTEETETRVSPQEDFPF
jgi:ferredoxin